MTSIDISELKQDIAEICAKAAHEVNKVWCEANGDTSQTHWKDAPEWQKTSAIRGVFGVFEGNTPQESHELWLKTKEEEGWVYGPVKNIETKAHPCFKPYDELPPEQRVKDTLFVNTVQTVARSLEKAIFGTDNYW